MDGMILQSAILKEDPSVLVNQFILMTLELILPRERRTIR